MRIAPTQRKLGLRRNVYVQASCKPEKAKSLPICAPKAKISQNHALKATPAKRLPLSFLIPISCSLSASWRMKQGRPSSQPQALREERERERERDREGATRKNKELETQCPESTYIISSIHSFIHPSIRPSVHPSVHPPIHHPSIHSSIRLPIHPILSYPSVLTSICPSTLNPFINPSRKTFYKHFGEPF